MPNLRQLSTDANGNPILIYPQEIVSTIAEPLSGPLTVDDVFDRFPDTVYNQNRDSHLYKLLTALCGDAGAGILTKQSFMSRLKNEGNLLTFTDLDTLYSHTLKFPRLSDETYSLDPSTAVLTPLEWDAVHLADEKYSARVRLFLTAIREGCTPQGMADAAESATGIQCDVWENYRAQYDVLSDDPLGIVFQGQTNSPHEFVVTPRIASGDPKTFTVASQTTTKLTKAPTFSGKPWIVHGYVTGDVVYPTTPNGHFYRVTTGGTSVTEPTWPLTDLTIDPFVPDVTASGGTVTHDGIVYAEIGAVNDDYAVDSTDATYLLPEYERNLIAVLDLLRPWGTLLTIQPTEVHFKPITHDDGTTPIAWKTDASSTRFKMTRFVTGAQTVTWPIADDVTQDRSNGFFIQSGVEKEASHLPWTQKERPTIYHTIEGVHAYRDEALADPSYDTADFYNVATNYGTYRSEHIGPFDATFSQLYPVFQTIPKDDLLDAVKAISLQNTPLIFTGRHR